MNSTSIHEDAGSVPAVSCGIGCRCGLDLMLLWLWRRPAVIALIRPLGWEPPYASDVAPKSKKRSDYSGLGRYRGSSSVPSLAQWFKGSSIATASV